MNTEYIRLSNQRNCSHTHTHTKRHTRIGPLLPCSQLLRGAIRLEIQRDGEHWKGNRWISPHLETCDACHRCTHAPVIVMFALFLGTRVWRDVTAHVPGSSEYTFMTYTKCKYMYKYHRQLIINSRYSRYLPISQKISSSWYKCSFLTNHLIQPNICIRINEGTCWVFLEGLTETNNTMYDVLIADADFWIDTRRISLWCVGNMGKKALVILTMTTLFWNPNVFSLQYKQINNSFIVN